MSSPLPVKGEEISSAPCSVRKAASVLRRFLASETVSEIGTAKGYVESVLLSLQEMQARGKENPENGIEGLRGARSSKFFNVEQAPKEPEIKKENPENGIEGLRGARSSKFFNVEQAPKEPEIKTKKKSRKEKEPKQKKEEEAKVDFTALLGHELDGGEIEKQVNGELGHEELPSTPRQEDLSQKGEKQKKKERRRSGGAAVDVNMDDTQAFRKAEGGGLDDTKSAKKKTKRKSIDGVGLLGTPAKEEAAGARAEDQDMTPADDVGKKKKKKKHRDDTLTPMKEESNKVLTEHMISSRGDSGVQPQSSIVKKSKKKRSSEVSPGNLLEQHRKSKKLRVSD